MAADEAASEAIGRRARRTKPAEPTIVLDGGDARLEPGGERPRVEAPPLQLFEVKVPRWRVLLDHVGITGEDVKRRWRLNAEMSNFVALHTSDDGKIDARLYDLVTQAKRVEAKDVDSGWTAFNAARRHALAELAPQQLLSEARNVRSAAATKLTGWRLDAVKRQLQGLSKQQPSVTYDQVAAATQVLDEHHDNRYRQLAVHARSLRFLGTLVIGLLVLFGFIVYQGWTPLASDTALGTLGSYIAVVALGCMGALLSVFTSRISGPDENQLADMAKRNTGYVRPLLGALSAVVVVLVLESGVQSVITLEGDAVYLGAVLAGFSERFISRTLDGLISR